MKLNLILFLVAILVFSSCNGKNQKAVNIKKTDDVLLVASKMPRDSIYNKYLVNGAWKLPIYSTAFQQKIDEALAIDSTYAYLWQQKAMPLYKQQKYQVGKPFLDKAVLYDEKEHLDYRGFMKCIFSKDYRGAIEDFSKYKATYGYGYEMDHTYDFYIGLSHLQLNNFEEAIKFLEASIAYDIEKSGQKTGHYLDKFYLAIANQEIENYERSVSLLNEVLDDYDKFSDAKYYLGVSLLRMGQKEQAMELFKQAKVDFENGYTITEDNADYEKYPYQILHY